MGLLQWYRQIYEFTVSISIIDTNFVNVSSFILLRIIPLSLALLKGRGPHNRLWPKEKYGFLDHAACLPEKSPVGKGMIIGLAIRVGGLGSCRLDRPAYTIGSDTNPTRLLIGLKFWTQTRLAWQPCYPNTTWVTRLLSTKPWNLNPWLIREVENWEPNVYQNKINTSVNKSNGKFTQIGTGPNYRRVKLKHWSENLEEIQEKMRTTRSAAVRECGLRAMGVRCAGRCGYAD